MLRQYCLYKVKKITLTTTFCDQRISRIEKNIGLKSSKISHLIREYIRYFSASAPSYQSRSLQHPLFIKHLCGLAAFCRAYGDRKRLKTQIVFVDVDKVVVSVVMHFVMSFLQADAFRIHYTLTIYHDETIILRKKFKVLKTQELLVLFSATYINF